MTDLQTLKDAIERDDLPAAAAILARNSQVVGATDAVGATALHYAAFHGRRGIVRLLVEHGANVNHRDGQFGATPAGWAIEYLRELGGQLSIELNDMTYAIETRDVKWVRRLLTRFPQLKNGRNEDQITFRQLATDCSDPQIAALFADGKD